MKKNIGYLMAIIGFIMILVNAIDYLFNMDIFSPVIFILGIVFVAIGLRNTKNVIGGQ